MPITDNVKPENTSERFLPLPAQTSGYTLHEIPVLYEWEAADILEQMDQSMTNFCKLIQQSMAKHINNHSKNTTALHWYFQTLSYVHVSWYCHIMLFATTHGHLRIYDLQTSWKHWSLAWCKWLNGTGTEETQRSRSRAQQIPVAQHVSFVLIIQHGKNSLQTVQI